MRPISERKGINTTSKEETGDNRKIDTKEYNYTIVDDISININNVFIKENNLLKFQNNNKSLSIKSSLENKQFLYISYIEKNLNFSILPCIEKFL